MEACSTIRDNEGKKGASHKMGFRRETNKMGKRGNPTPYPSVQNAFRGLQQVHKVDCGETFTHLVKYTSVRDLCGRVGEQEVELEQMGPKNAFLNGDIEEDLDRIADLGSLGLA